MCDWLAAHSTAVLRPTPTTTYCTDYSAFHDKYYDYDFFNLALICSMYYLIITINSNSTSTSTSTSKQQYGCIAM